MSDFSLPSGRPEFIPTNPYEVSIYISDSLYEQIPEEKRGQILENGSLGRYVPITIKDTQCIKARDVIQILANTLNVNENQIKVRITSNTYSLSNPSNLDRSIAKELGKRLWGRDYEADHI